MFGLARGSCTAMGTERPCCPVCRNCTGLFVAACCVAVFCNSVFNGGGSFCLCGWSELDELVELEELVVPVVVWSNSISVCMCLFFVLCQFIALTLYW
jgi:hypothetical protein